MLRNPYNTRLQERNFQQNLNNFFHAAKNNDEKTIENLLKNGFKADERNAQNRTALMEASKRGYSKIVKLLLDARADVNATDNRGLTALMEASISSGSISEVLVTVDLLTAAGANLELKSLSHERTALYRAVALGHNAVIRALIEKGADINTTGDYNGLTPLMKAVVNDRDNILELLLTAGANLSAKNDNDDTALNLARKNRQSPKSFCILKNHGHPTFQTRLDALNENVKIPDEFICPILQTGIMNDPITLSSGITCDRQSLVNYFAANYFPQTLPCPLTKIIINKRELFNETNIIVKQNIDTFLKSHEKKLATKEEKGKKRRHSDLETTEEDSRPRKMMHYLYHLFSQPTNESSAENNAQPISLPKPT